MVAGHLPYDAAVAPTPQSIEPPPAPSSGEIPNPFRGDEGQAPLPPQAQTQLQQPDAQSPGFVEPSAAEPNALRLQPASEGFPPAVPPGPDGAPARPMRPMPMSNNHFPPMANAGSYPEFRAWLSSAEPVATAGQSHEAAARQYVVPTVDVTSSPAFEVSPAPMADEAAPVAETVTESESQWRLVIHDQAEGGAASNREAPLFRPPQLDDAQAPAMATRHPRASKPSLEERTGAALKRFMSWEMPPGATR
jgi:hypothetical protein